MEILAKEQLLQLVLDNIPSFVFWKDLESNYLGCNHKFAQSAGLSSPDEIVGKTDYELSWTKADADYYRKIDKEVMGSGVPQINFEESQTIDGKTSWLNTSKIPLFDDQGRVIGILGTYEDITERKMSELQLLENNKVLTKINAQLESANVDLEQFAYATSHDLQEPLRMIGGFTGLIEKRYAQHLDAKGQDYINFIKEATQRMSNLISQILSYTKLEKIEDKYELVNLSTLMSNVLKNLDALIVRRGGEVRVDCALPEVVCQSQRIQMLLYNLIGNGLKFNTSLTPTVHMSCSDQDTHWCFKLTDNGIGIKDEYKDYVFKPFKRLNTRDKFPGTGIGLSLCKRIVLLHGGDIWFTSDPGEGTTFYFTLSKAPLSAKETDTEQGMVVMQA